MNPVALDRQSVVPLYYQIQQQLLEQIAQGQKAQDTLGFAKEYAGGVLAKLDGVKGKPGKAPVLREDAIAWFPADTTFAAAFDVRLARKQGVANDSVNQLLRLIPERERKEMYEFFEKTGRTKEVWFYEIFPPEGKKKYSKTRPMRYEEFAGCQTWWGSEGRSGRVENEHAFARPQCDQVLAVVEAESSDPGAPGL